MNYIKEGTEFLDQLKDKVHEQYEEIERLNNIIDEIETIVYSDMSNIDVRISIQETIDKLRDSDKE